MSRTLFEHAVAPILVVFGAAGALVLLTTLAVGQPFGLGAIGSVQFTVNTTAAALAATLGILMALVLLTVQLTAQRFSLNIVDLFIHSPLNLGIILLFTVAIIYSLWISVVIREEFIPEFGVYLALGLATLCFSLLVPYSLHLFTILRPSNLLQALRREVTGAAQSAIRGKPIAACHALAAERIENIGDVGRGAISQGDADTARRSIWALHDTLTDYLSVKSSLPDDWFKAEAKVVRGGHEAAIEQIRESGLWIERRVVEELQDVFNAALLSRMDDITHTVAQALRLVGEEAMRCNDVPLMRLVSKFFNTFLRATINRGEVRGGYDTLYEYELLADAALLPAPDFAIEIAERLAYYGEAAGGRLLWMAAASAHDLRSLAEQNTRRGGESVVTQRFISLLLETVQRVQGRDPILGRQLHKTVVTLGCFFLATGEPSCAARLRSGLLGIAGDELDRIQQELAAVLDPEFWEVTERWINFDYMDSESRVRLGEFMSLSATADFDLARH